MKILISGASGLVGKALSKKLLELDHEVFTLTRDPKSVQSHEIFWNPESLPLNLEDYEDMDVFVNLSGENIATGRWTEAKKKKILTSRSQATKTLSGIISSLKAPPKLLINASAIGYYGDRGDESLTEESGPGHNFLSEVCKAWENAVNVDESKTRVVFLRIGAVLSKDGGALSKMLLPFKLGIGGKLGSGKQYFSFIAIDDLLDIILFAIENKALSGPINAVSPYPITNQQFTDSLAKVLHRPAFLPLPAFAAKFIFGQMADELLLSSAKVFPKKLTDAGFTFKYPDIHDALKHTLQLH